MYTQGYGRNTEIFAVESKTNFVIVKSTKKDISVNIQLRNMDGTYYILSSSQRPDRNIISHVFAHEFPDCIEIKPVFFVKIKVVE